MATSTEFFNFLNSCTLEKTSDDCYTPVAVYDEVVKFVGEKIIDLSDRIIVRPFYPGGDYEHFEYPDNCIVIDNPPFSIFKRILEFYVSRKIPFFFFCPGLQAFRPFPLCYIVAGAEVRYHNGLVINTGFVTNLVPGIRVWISGTLHDRINMAQNKKCANVKKAKSSHYRRGCLPPYIITSARLSKYCTKGKDLKIKANQILCFVHTWGKVRVYGNGFCISDEAVKEIAATFTDDDRKNDIF